MPGLNAQQIEDLEQGDLVLYRSGRGIYYVEAEAVVDDVDVEGKMVVITLKKIIEIGRNADCTKNEQLTALPEELSFNI